MAWELELLNESEPEPRLTRRHCGVSSPEMSGDCSKRLSPKPYYWLSLSGAAGGPGLAGASGSGTACSHVSALMPIASAGAAAKTWEEPSKKIAAAESSPSKRTIILEYSARVNSTLELHHPLHPELVCCQFQNPTPEAEFFGRPIMSALPSLSLPGPHQAPLDQMNLLPRHSFQSGQLVAGTSISAGNHGVRHRKISNNQRE